MLFHHNLERCSSSLPLGRADASIARPLLNHNLFTVLDVYALISRLTVEAAALQVEKRVDWSDGFVFDCQPLNSQSQEILL